MNVLLHFLFNYVFISQVLGDIRPYALLVFVASVVIDADHIPYIAKYRGKIIQRKFGSESRTALHELLGLTAVSIALSLLSLYVDGMILKIISFSIVLHYTLDFLVGRTRPFYPFSNEEIFLGICPDKYRVPVEVVLTGFFGVMFWLLMKN